MTLILTFPLRARLPSKSKPQQNTILQQRILSVQTETFIESKTVLVYQIPNKGLLYNEHYTCHKLRVSKILIKV